MPDNEMMGDEQLPQESGAYPAAVHMLKMKEDEWSAFLAGLT